MNFNLIKAYFKSISGATAIEYGLIAGLLSVLIIAGLLIAGPQIQEMFAFVGLELAAQNS